MTTRPVRAGVSAETEPRDVGFYGGGVIRVSPAATIDVSWDYGDHENALRVLTRLHQETRARILTTVYPDKSDAELHEILVRLDAEPNRPTTDG